MDTHWHALILALPPDHAQWSAWGRNQWETAPNHGLRVHIFQSWETPSGTLKPLGALASESDYLNTFPARHDQDHIYWPKVEGNALAAPEGNRHWLFSQVPLTNLDGIALKKAPRSWLNFRRVRKVENHYLSDWLSARLLLLEGETDRPLNGFETRVVPDVVPDYVDFIDDPGTQLWVNPILILISFPENSLEYSEEENSWKELIEFLRTTQSISHIEPLARGTHPFTLACLEELTKRLQKSEDPQSSVRSPLERLIWGKTPGQDYHWREFLGLDQLGTRFLSSPDKTVWVGRQPVNEKTIPTDLFSQLYNLITEDWCSHLGMLREDGIDSDQSKTLAPGDSYRYTPVGSEEEPRPRPQTPETAQDWLDLAGDYLPETPFGCFLNKVFVRTLELAEGDLSLLPDLLRYLPNQLAAGNQELRPEFFDRLFREAFHRLRPVWVPFPKFHSAVNPEGGYGEFIKTVQTNYESLYSDWGIDLTNCRPRNHYRFFQDLLANLGRCRPSGQVVTLHQHWYESWIRFLFQDKADVKIQFRLPNQCGVTLGISLLGGEEVPGGRLGVDLPVESCPLPAPEDIHFY